MTLTPRILPREEAARYCGFRAATDAFDKFAKAMGFRKVPGRNGCYDRKQMDTALDANMGLTKQAKQSAADEWFSQHGQG